MAMSEGLTTWLKQDCRNMGLEILCAYHSINTLNEIRAS